MKVWKSPVFYFGILLVAAVVSLLVAPFVVDWNSYRAGLEDYGRKLTGRDVTIAGPISARLFPWPRLTIEDIHLANPPGLAEPEFASAGRIVVRMPLAGLMQGNFNVEGVDIEHPVIAFERLASGEGNWSFKPAADPGRSGLLARVKLDRITLRDGVIRVVDRRRGETHQIDSFNASIAAPGVVGPWHMRSVGLYAGHAIDIGLNTGSWKEGEPFRFSLRAAAADGSGLVFNFDGAQSGGKAEGEFRVEPAAAADGKADAEGQLRPLVFKSRMTATFDEVGLDKIEIAPRDPKDGGTLMNGSARLKLGSHITASAELSAATLDFDELAGAETRSLLREGGGLAVADGLLALLPEDVSLAGTLKVTALKVGGDTLDNVALAVDAGHDAIRVKEFSTSLPGRSRALYRGVFFPGKNGAELAGSLAVESGDLRQLVSWVWPEAKERIGKTWTGSRGRFKLQTDVSVTQSRLRFSKAQYEIDGERGSGDFSVTSAGRGGVDIRLETRRIDFDNFIAGGVTAFSAQGSEGLGGLFGLVVPHDGAADLRLTVQAGEMLLNGVTASGVVVDLASGANGFDLRALEIGSVGGARLEATGLILDNGAGPDGSIGLAVKADDPRGLLRLLGLISGTDDPAWATQLGAIALKGSIAVKSKDHKPETSFDAGGTAGDLIVSAAGQIGSASALDEIEWSGSAEFRSLTSGHLMRLGGLSPAVDDAAPARLVVTAAGTVRDGFVSDVQLQAYGARLDYNGMIRASAQGLGLDGKLALRSTDAAQMIAAAGLPVLALPSGVLVLDATVAAADGEYTLPDLAGRLGNSKVAGDVRLDKDLKLTGNIETGAFALRDLLAITFLNWTGAAPDLETGFASALPFGLTGELWIKPAALAVHEQFTVQDVQIGITAARDEIRLAMFGKDETGRDAHIEIGSRGTDASRRLDGKISIPIDLHTQLRLAGGSPVAAGQGSIEVRFETEGRSSGGALAAVRGNGSYSFDGVKFPGISPDVFARMIGEAKDSAGLTAAFDGLRGGDGLSAGRAGGYIKIANGEVAFQSFGIATPDADVEVRILGELPQGAIDADISLKLKARPNLPEMSISYAGPPQSLARSEENSELATRLGIALMQQGVDELERLQKEQQRLAIEEDKLRLEDEARLQDYYAQRDELLLRKRELKVHAEMRVAEAERLRLKLQAEFSANSEMNKAEVKQRQREIRIYRRLARLQRASGSGEVVKPKPPAPLTVSQPQQEGPVIPAHPEDAPVVILPPPSPSQ